MKFQARIVLFHRLQAAIKEHRLITAGNHVLVGVSGGADSVALLAALCRLVPKLDISITAAHLHHGIRGKAADEDARFVAGLAKRLGVPLERGRADVPRRAKRKGLSLEMAAREARYAFFARAARRAGADIVATAHNADDQAETVMLRLARGAGPDGLSGIPVRSSLCGVLVVRPMLEVTRKEVLAFLDRQNLDWREDSSNRDVSFQRNKMRQELLPLLERELNPSIRKALRRTACILRDENDWLDGLCAELLAKYQCAGGGLVVDGLRTEPAAARRRVLRQWLVAAGAAVDRINFDTLSRADRLLCRAKGSGMVELPDGRVIRRQYGHVLVETRAPVRPVNAFRVRTPIPGELLLVESGLRVTTIVAPGLSKDKCRGPGRLPARASIRKSAVGRRAVYIRTWRAGDRMTPLRMRGSKKLQDIFVDQKVPAARRDRVPVFECGGEIIWIPGYRVARGWEIADQSAPALQIRVECICHS